jgi:RimJ/RimL family protein N-acetyltransferase
MILQTSRLILEPIAETHFEDLARLRSNPLVMAQMMGGTETREEASVTFAAYQKSWARQGFGAWAIIARSDSEFLGETGLRQRESGEIALRFALKTSAQGHGFASEAVAAALDFAFAQARMTEVTAVSQASNAASLRVLTSNGFRCLRQERRNGKDLTFFALSAGEWRSAISTDRK